MSVQQRVRARTQTGVKLKRRPGRPSAEQAAGIADAILTAAMEIFLARGFEAASMEAIALKADIPKTTLYKRYADKRALLAAVIDLRVSEWSESSARKNWMLGDKLEIRLKRLCVMLLTRAMDPEIRAYSRLAAAAWSAPDESDRRRDVIGLSNMLDFLEREIRERGAMEKIKVKSPRRVATALMSMLAGWLQLRDQDASASKAEARAFARSAVDLLMKGVSHW